VSVVFSPRDLQGFVERKRPLPDPVGERRAVHELHHQRPERELVRARRRRVLEPVDLRDVRVVERRERD
jgi:hypothetical protein